MSSQSATTDDANPDHWKVRLLQIPINQIAVDLQAPMAKLQSELHYLSRDCPTVRESALPYLQLLQPIVVIKAADESGSNATGSYILIAGFRTFQLCCEHYPRNKKCRVHCIEGVDESQLEDLQILDAIGIKVLQHPESVDLGWIAHTLKMNKSQRQKVDDLLPVGSDEQLAHFLGMGRTTLNERMQFSKLWMQQLKNADKKPEAVKVDLFGSMGVDVK